MGEGRRNAGLISLSFLVGLALLIVGDWLGIGVGKGILELLLPPVFTLAYLRRKWLSVKIYKISGERLSDVASQVVAFLIISGVQLGAFAAFMVFLYYYF